MKNNLTKDFRAAFGGYSRIIGIFFASISLFSWLQKMFQWPLSRIFDAIIKAYRDSIHPVIDFVFGWWVNLLPFSVPAWWHDSIVIYLVFGGAVVRTQSMFVEIQTSSEYNRIPTRIEKIIEALIRTIRFTISIVIWPTQFANFWIKPHCFSHVFLPSALITARSDVDIFYTAERFRNSLSDGRPMEYATYLFNLRWVFAFQLMAISVAIFIYIITNQILR